MQKTKLKLKPIFKNALLAFSSFLITLIFLEIVLSVVAVAPIPPKQSPKEDWALVPERVWTEYHPDLGWYNQKNKEAVMKIGGRETSVRTNSAGFRADREYSLEKPAGVTRIALIGDSFVFGFGVEKEEAIGAMLEKDNEQLEVMNLGVPGYGIDQILVAYRSIARHYKPDYVLIGIFPEDFWRSTRSFHDSGHAKPYFKLVGGELELHNAPVPEQFSLKVDQFPRVVETKGVYSLLLRSKLFSLIDKSWRRLGKNLGFLDPTLADEWVLGRAIYRQLIDEIEADGAVPVAFLIPMDRWVRQTEDASLHKSICRFSNREGINFIDLTPIFRSHVNEGNFNEYYIENDWHWTGKGHRLAADSIKEYFKMKGWPDL